jgi:hypothetical protein
MAVLKWVVSMDDDQRRVLGHRMRGAAPGLEASDPIRGRVDRHESALIIALFLEYARGHGLSPAEAESLLARPGRAGPRALEVLGLGAGAGAQPGRGAEARAGERREARARVPGR